MIALPTFRGAISGFNPASLSPAAWYSDTGSNAAQWDDLSGNGRHATQATGVSQPAIVTNALNGRQVRRFDGSNDFLAIADRALLRNLAGATVFAVVNPAVQTAGGKAIFSYHSSSGNTNLFFAAQNGSQLNYGGRRVAADAGDFNTFGNFTANTPRIITTQQRWSAAQKEAWITVNQNDLDTSFQTAGNSENANSAFDPCIGKNASDSTLFFNGDIAELLIFQRAITTTERQALEGYASAKYNIALA
jgi:hypothetical protein